MCLICLVFIFTHGLYILTTIKQGSVQEHCDLKVPNVMSRAGVLTPLVRGTSYLVRA